MVLNLDTKVSPPPTVAIRPINWAHAVVNGDIHEFADEVSSLVSFLIRTSHQRAREWKILEANQELVYQLQQSCMCSQPTV